MSHWVELADWSKQVGVELVLLEGGSAARGLLADLINNVVASFAEFERELLQERLLDAHARMRERGLRSAGRVPLGYKADLATRQLVTDDEAAVVRAFFDGCAAGRVGREHRAVGERYWPSDEGPRSSGRQPRYYGCRGDAERPACTPSVQVSAQKVEAIVLAVLKKAGPHFISR